MSVGCVDVLVLVLGLMDVDGEQKMSLTSDM